MVKGEQSARQLLALIFGPHAPHARARKMIPTLEVAAGVWFPEGKHADSVVDFGKGELLAILGGAMKKALRDKVANPDFAFISRAEMGLCSLLHRLKAKANATAIWQKLDRPQ